MLKMDLVYVIRHKVLVEGLSQKQVAKELGISRNTVRKYLHQSEPFSQRTVQRPAFVLDRVKDRIEQLCQQWKQKTNHKHRLTGSRIHQQLLQEGFNVGISTVRNYLREQRRRAAEVYIPLLHSPGDEAQVDFFEVTVEINGNQQKAWMFVMHLMYSGRDFAWLYPYSDQVSFLDGHVRAFAHFGAVPARCVYDNLKAAVVKVMFPLRQLAPKFLALASHYLFEPCFARPYTGHDKGGVEARGKGIRWQHLTPIPSGQTLEQLSYQLLQSLDSQCDTRRDQEGKTVAEKFVEEFRALKTLPARPFESRQLVFAKASQQATIKVQGAEYSLPSQWKQLEVTVFVGPVDLKICCQGKEVIKQRVPARAKNISYLDYLEPLATKPQAMRQISAKLLAELPAPFQQLWQLLEESHGALQTARIFSKIVKAIPIHGPQKVAEAIEDCLQAQEVHLLGLAKILREERATPIAIPEALAGFEVESAKAADYEHLLRGENS